MKTLLMAASALSLIAAPAFAQSAADVHINASVDTACADISGFSNTIDLGELPIDNDGYLVGNGGFVALAGGDFASLTGGAQVWCNTASTITVYGTPLVHESLTNIDDGDRTWDDGFMRHIDLRLAGFNYGGLDFGNDLNTGNLLDNAANELSRTSAGAFQGPVTGQAEIWTGDYLWEQGMMRPLGGAYRAQFTFTVSPNS